MQIVLIDNEQRNSLWPLTASKSVADLRCGILTIKERWEAKTKFPVFIQTEKYLQNLYSTVEEIDEVIIIDAAVFANDELFDKIMTLQPNEALIDQSGFVAGALEFFPSSFTRAEILSYFRNVSKIERVRRLQQTWELFQWNDEMIREDFKLVTKGKSSQSLSPTNFIHQQANIFIEEGARVEFAFLNSTTGPIYIGKDAEVWEGAVIRGPFALGNNAAIKANAKIYGATTVGPWCAAGGEIKNAIISGYSNKAHDGYLGDSVIGEWCNLGAGTTNSNVKNTAATVKMWNAFSKTYEEVGVKAGLVMGDYTRVSINSSINTGSVYGVSANIFGKGLLPTVIDSFTWGTEEKYDFDKAIQAIDNWKKFKHQSLSSAEFYVLKHIFEQNKKQ